MSEPRLLPSSDYNKLKAAFRDLVDLAGGNRRSASLTRSSEGRISAAKHNQYNDRFAAIDHIADLEADVGDPVVTRALAELSGFTLVQNPQNSSRAVESEYLVHLARLIGRGSLVTTELAAAVADGLITRDEAQRLVNAVNKAMQSLADFRGKVEKILN